jgi:hypothetical protein
MRWAGPVVSIGVMRKAKNVLVGKPEEKRLLERPRRRWKDNTKIDIREIG